MFLLKLYCLRHFVIVQKVPGFSRIRVGMQAHSIAIVALVNESPLLLSRWLLKATMNNISVTADEALSLAAERLKDLKAEQCDVIKAFISRNDVFAALPTGPAKAYAATQS